MKILYVDLEREWRGGQSQALLTLEGLRARGHDASLLAVGHSPLARRAQAAGIPVHATGPQARQFSAAYVLRRVVSKVKFDVLPANEPHALTSIWLARGHRKAALVVSRRVAYPLKCGAQSMKRFQSAGRIIAISHFVEESLLASGISKEKIRVVHEGVEIPSPVNLEARAKARQRWRVEEDEFLFGCVGYLLPEKGQEFALLALRAVRARFPRARLLLAGDGPCRRKLESLASELGLRDAVIFAGFVENIPEVYAALDAFLFPSLAEPLGTSLLAAMAWGLAVVAVASGGVPEYVEHSRTGLLVQRSEAGQLSARMLELLCHPELAKRLATEARHMIEEHFSADNMVENTIRVYNELTS